MPCLLPPDLAAIQPFPPFPASSRESQQAPAGKGTAWPRQSEYNDLNGASWTVVNGKEISWNLNLTKRNDPDY